MVKPKHNVVFVPLWVQEAMPLEGVNVEHGVDKQLLLSLPQLSQSTILSDTDILFYFLLNSHIHELTGNLFHDMTTLSQLPHNQQWANQHVTPQVNDQFSSSSIMKDITQRVEEGSPCNGPLVDFLPVAFDGHTVLLFEKYSDSVPDARSALKSIDDTLRTLTMQRTFNGCKDLAVLEWFIVHDKTVS